MINHGKWQQALDFALDNSHSEYGFATRLAKENYWTKAFTQRAILEYKKFMFLAATADLMVSPSPVVDTVWHQHLTFTQSYQDFCTLLGKQIHHVPSTHDSQDFEKFRQAKDRTDKLYAENFGEQPKDIWRYAGMYESLGLRKARIKLRGGVIIGLFAFVTLLIPAFIVLLPIYVRINSVLFLSVWVAMVIFFFVLLEIFNRRYLTSIVSSIDRTSFLFDLHPLEVIYAKTQKLPHAINGLLNELILSNKISKRDQGLYAEIDSSLASKTEQFQVLSLLEKWPGTRYDALLRLLQSKPAIANVGECMDAVQKYFIKSAKFSRLFYTNFVVLSIVMLLGFTRMLTGMDRGRPVDIIGTLLFASTVLIILYLSRLPKRVLSYTITNLYRQKVSRRISSTSRYVDDDVQWQYFLFGAAVLSPSLAPEVEQFDRQAYASSGTDSSSGDSSSCGSSCSSCGGCGGD